MRLLVLLSLVVAFGAQASPTFVGIGAFTGFRDFRVSYANALSADGATVVGSTTSLICDPQGNSWCMEAFRWSFDTGMQGLGGADLPGFHDSSEAFAVSADGSVVVGKGMISDDGDWGDAFRWTEADGMVMIAFSNHYDDGASSTDVSADGSIVVGRITLFDYSTYESSTFGFIWTDGVSEDTGEFNVPIAISSDGSVIAGNDLLGPYRWTEAGGYEHFPTQTMVHAISADGSTIVTSAFRWTESTGLVPLEADFYPNALSADGSIAVGQKNGQAVIQRATERRCFSQTSLPRWGSVRISPGGRSWMRREYRTTGSRSPAMG